MADGNSQNVKAIKKLELINNKKQSLINEIGEERLQKSLTACETLTNELNLLPGQLVSVTEFHRLLTLLPVR